MGTFRDTSSGRYLGTATFLEPFGTQVRTATSGYQFRDTRRAATFGSLWGHKFGLALLGTFGDTSSVRYLETATFWNLWGHKFGPLLWGTFGDTSRTATFGNLWGHKSGCYSWGTCGETSRAATFGNLCVHKSGQYFWEHLHANQVQFRCKLDAKQLQTR